MENNKENSTVIYRDQYGREIEVDIRDESVWLIAQQMGWLFGKSVNTINEHIQNIFKEGESKKLDVLRKTELSRIT